MRNYFRSAFVALALLVSACQPARHEEPASPLPAHYAGATLYRVDANASVVSVHVYKDGPLARFGHNHAIAVQQLTGSVFLQRELERSGFELSAPLAMLAVDRPADRAAAGADFPGELPPEAIAGTRANMLGPKLLTADLYPLLQMTAVSVRGKLPDLTWTVRVSLRGISTDVEFPAKVVVDGQRITADGSLTLSQSQLGLAPFSVLGGGLRVRDEMEIFYHVVAVRDGTVAKS